MSLVTGSMTSFMRATMFIYYCSVCIRDSPSLANYSVTIPPWGSQRRFFVLQTVITWNWNQRILRTRGLDADQTEAAIKVSQIMKCMEGLSETIVNNKNN